MVQTEVQQRAQVRSSDFATDFSALANTAGIYADARYALGQVSPALYTLPGDGLAQGVIKLGYCALFSLHYHPRCVNNCIPSCIVCHIQQLRAVHSCSQDKWHACGHSCLGVKDHLWKACQVCSLDIYHRPSSVDISCKAFHTNSCQGITGPSRSESRRNSSTAQSLIVSIDVDTCCAWKAKSTSPAYWSLSLSSCSALPNILILAYILTIMPIPRVTQLNADEYTKPLRTSQLQGLWDPLCGRR